MPLAVNVPVNRAANCLLLSTLEWATCPKNTSFNVLALYNLSRCLAQSLAGAVASSRYVPAMGVNRFDPMVTNDLVSDNSVF